MLLLLLVAAVAIGVAFGPRYLDELSADQRRTAAVNDTYEHLQAAIGALSVSGDVVAELKGGPVPAERLEQLEDRISSAATSAMRELDLAEDALAPLAGEPEASKMREAIAQGREAAQRLDETADGLVEAGALVRASVLVTSRMEELGQHVNGAVGATNRRDWDNAREDAQRAMSDADWCQEQLGAMQKTNGRVNRSAPTDPGIADALRVVSIQRRLAGLALEMAQTGEAGDIAAFNRSVAAYNELNATLTGMPLALFQNNPQVLLGDRIDSIVKSQTAVERARRAGDEAVELLRAIL